MAAQEVLSCKKWPAQPFTRNIAQMIKSRVEREDLLVKSIRISLDCVGIAVLNVGSVKGR